MVQSRIDEDEYEVHHEGDDVILHVNCDKWIHTPSIEDNSLVMAKAIDFLCENNNVTKIIFNQKRDFEYDSNQTQLLVEVASLFNFLAKRKDLFSAQTLNFFNASQKHVNRWYTNLQLVIFQLLKTDPIGAYVELKRLIRHEKIILDKIVDDSESKAMSRYMQLLNYVLGLFDNTKLITISKPYLAGYELGNRDIYRNIFQPIIKPDFMYTKLMADYPLDGVEIGSYMVEETEITIFSFPDTVQYLYHINPPEFKLSEDLYDILDLARKILAEHKPKRDEFIDPKRMRGVFVNVGRDLLDELSKYRGITLNDEELEMLTKILVRYTVGFGLIEILLADEKIQDISVNSPMGQTPIFIVHGDYDDCKTNIIPMRTEAESWASKLRLMSGRPLDEANPILDTEIELPSASARISVISPPLNPTGLAYSFRRHRDRPWTLPLFIKYKTINPIAAGLISFLVDGTRSFLIAGTRSSGKSSLLSAFLIEIMRRYRIITVEDTLELPTNPMRKLGYNIQSMKVGSSLSANTNEMSAENGIRSTLRLGDSSLIVGEVRSHEAKALYEAMRVGAAANVVAGTIHGDSPYGIFDRVVNDIGVPKTSFKATDIIVVVKPLKSADGLHKFRRVIQVTEVRKKWEDDPMLEGGFVDLLEYDAKIDELVPTDALISGDSEVLKMIAAGVKDFAGNWEAIWDNIKLRADIKKAQVDIAVKMKNNELLEAEFSIKCNDIFHKISEKVKEERGKLDTKIILYEWTEWLKKEVKKEKYSKIDKK